MVENGYLRAWSLGFIVHKFKRLKASEVGIKKADPDATEEIDCRRIWDRFTATELLEYSSVPVPSDPLALKNSMAALREAGHSLDSLEAVLRDSGIEVPSLVKHDVKPSDPEPEVEAWREPIETDTQIEIPVRDAALFVEDSCKSITLRQEDGVSAVVGQVVDAEDEATRILRFVFDKKEDRTLDDAKTWVRTYRGSVDSARGALRANGEDPDMFGFVFTEPDENHVRVVMPIVINEPVVSLKTKEDLLALLLK